MASESFIKGAEYYGPGAGLVFSGAGYRNATDDGDFNVSSYIQYGQGPPWWIALPGWQASSGDVVDRSTAVIYNGEEYTETYLLQDYDGPQSTFGSYLSAVAANASTWENISAEACGKEYQACHSRRQYRDVIMILDVEQGEPEGYDGCKYLFNLLHGKAFHSCSIAAGLPWIIGDMNLPMFLVLRQVLKNQASDVRYNRGFE